MQAFGEVIGRMLAAGSVVLLRGPLGAGKTTIAQGIARGLGVAEPVSSPSFTLIREYQCRRVAARLIHMDFYRLSGESEVRSLGVTDYFRGDDIVLVEWPERVGADLVVGLATDVLAVDIEYANLEHTLAAGGQGAPEADTGAGRTETVTGAERTEAETGAGHAAATGGGRVEVATGAAHVVAEADSGRVVAFTGSSRGSWELVGALAAPAGVAER
jgi:tRNA threonylcarbamoyladenosine biosynthesis protein TsaE